MRSFRHDHSRLRERVRWPAITLVATLAAGAAARDCTATAQRIGRKHFTYAQVFGVATDGDRPPSSDILSRLPTIVGWLDDETYLEEREDATDRPRQVFAVRASEGSEILYRDYREMQQDLPKGVSADEPEARTRDLTAYIFKHQGDLYHYDAVRRRLRRLTATPAEEQNPRFSPDANWIAYTRDHDLFAYDLGAALERQLTSDGSDTVYNGWASWVYYEEILGRRSKYAAFWWAPDSTQLAFMRFDDEPVPVFPIFHADGQHGTLERQRYPKAGDPNPFVAMGVANVRTGKIAWMDFDRQADH